MSQYTEKELDYMIEDALNEVFLKNNKVLSSSDMISLAMIGFLCSLTESGPIYGQSGPIYGQSGQACPVTSVDNIEFDLNK